MFRCSDVQRYSIINYTDSWTPMPKVVNCTASMCAYIWTYFGMKLLSKTLSLPAIIRKCGPADRTAMHSAPLPDWQVEWPLYSRCVRFRSICCPQSYPSFCRDLVANLVYFSSSENVFSEQYRKVKFVPEFRQRLFNTIQKREGRIPDFHIS